MGWWWKSLHHSPKVNLDPSSPDLPQLAPFILHGDGSHSQTSKLPHVLSLVSHPPAHSEGRGTVNRAGKLKMEVASAIQHPNAGYSQWFFTDVV